jgi:hypothetical protein
VQEPKQTKTHAEKIGNPAHGQPHPDIAPVGFSRIMPSQKGCGRFTNSLRQSGVRFGPEEALFDMKKT